MIVTDIAELKLANSEAEPGEAAETVRLLERELKASPRPGIGLAAPQIGIHKRVAIVRTANASIDLVNPRIINKERGILVKGEACLSLPGISADTMRFDEVLVECGNGSSFVATGFEAIVVQHEIDHLDGVLITDRAAMRNTGRNDPCPCGAKGPEGKPVKFKRCHGR